MDIPIGVILSEAKNLHEEKRLRERFFASLRMTRMLPDYFLKLHHCWGTSSHHPPSPVGTTEIIQDSAVPMGLKNDVCLPNTQR